MVRGWFTINRGRPAAFMRFAPRPCAAQTPAAPTDWRTAIRKFAAEHFKQPAWGYSHSVRDYALARSMAAADGVKLDDGVLFCSFRPREAPA